MESFRYRRWNTCLWLKTQKFSERFFNHVFKPGALSGITDFYSNAWHDGSQLRNLSHAFITVNEKWCYYRRGTGLSPAVVNGHGAGVSTGFRWFSGSNPASYVSPEFKNIVLYHIISRLSISTQIMFPEQIGTTALRLPAYKTVDIQTGDFWGWMVCASCMKMAAGANLPSGKCWHYSEAKNSVMAQFIKCHRLVARALTGIDVWIQVARLLLHTGKTAPPWQVTKKPCWHLRSGLMWR